MFRSNAKIYMDKIEDKNYNVISSNTNVIELGKVYEKNNSIVIPIKSINSGNSDIVINYNDEISITTPIHVNKYGLISTYSIMPSTDMLVISLVFINLIIIKILIEKLKRNEKKSFYSYKNITLLSLIIFMSFTLLINITYILKSLLGSYENIFHSFDIVSSLVYFFDAPIAFFRILTPIIIIIFIAIFISNISLIKHEGKSIYNLLGTFLCITLIVISFTIFKINSIICRYLINPLEKITYDRIVYFLNIVEPTFIISLFCFLECLILSIVIYGIRSSKRKINYDKDYIIILGCAIRKDGTLLPLLRGRVDRAIEFAKEQKNISNKDIIFIPSGGQGKDEVISESLAMKNYLLENNIKEENIIMEDKSTSTYENMLFSKKIIDKHNKNSKVVFSTTNYHIFRSGVLANSVGLKCDGIGKETKWYFWPNAFVRELIAVLVSNKKDYIIISLLILVFTIFTSIIKYFAI